MFALPDSIGAANSIMSRILFLIFLGATASADPIYQKVFGAVNINDDSGNLNSWQAPSQCTDELDCLAKARNYCTGEPTCVLIRSYQGSAKIGGGWVIANAANKAAFPLKANGVWLSPFLCISPQHVCMHRQLCELPCAHRFGLGHLPQDRVALSPYLGPALCIYMPVVQGAKHMSWLASAPHFRSLGPRPVRRPWNKE